MEKRIILISLITIILLVGIFIMWKVFFDKDKNNIPKKNYGSLTEISYSCSGDMLGNTYYVSVNILDNEIIVKDADTHNDPIIKSVYKLTNKKILDNIIDIIELYDIPSLDKAKIDDNYFVYDACTPTLMLTYKKGNKSNHIEYYSISFYAKMSDLKRNQLDIIRDNINKLINSDSLISTTTLEED